ncbi:MAG: hypothetical protein U0V73_09345 [Acidimicrobiia bacterium]
MPDDPREPEPRQPSAPQFEPDLDLITDMERGTRHDVSQTPFPNGEPEPGAPPPPPFDPHPELMGEMEKAPPGYRRPRRHWWQRRHAADGTSKSRTT